MGTIVKYKPGYCNICEDYVKGKGSFKKTNHLLHVILSLVLSLGFYIAISLLLENAENEQSVVKMADTTMLMSLFAMSYLFVRFVNGLRSSPWDDIENYTCIRCGNEDLTVRKPKTENTSI